MIGSTQRIFSRLQGLTSQQEHAYWREKYKRVSMRRSRVVMASIRVSSFTPRSVGPTLSDMLGTWVPLEEGRQLADKNGVFQKIHKIFEYVQGDKSPPPAPKHQLATAARNKASKAQPQARRSQANHQPVHQPSHQPNHGE